METIIGLTILFLFYIALGILMNKFARMVGNHITIFLTFLYRSIKELIHNFKENL